MTNAQTSAATGEPVLRGATITSLVLLGAGALGGALCVFAFISEPSRAFHSYLIAYAFALTIVLGCMAFVMIGHAANASWPVSVRRLAEAVLPAMPLLALLFIPVALGIHHLYPWAHPHDYPESIERVLKHRQPYMNAAWFAARAAGCLVLWSVIAWRLRSDSLAMDRGASAERCARRLRRLSYIGLPLVTLTVGFMAFDWLMSLSPRFASSIFGVLFIAMCLFGGTAALAIVSAIAHARAPLHAIGAAHFHALGRLLLAFLVFLGYVAFFQFLLIWMGNKPTEAEWYVARSQGGYRWTSAFLVLGHFALPFFVLLSYRWKRSGAVLAPIAGFCLIAQYVHLFWLIAPSSPRPQLAWTDPVALLAVLGLCGALDLWLQRGKSLAATRDPRFVEALSYESE